MKKSIFISFILLIVLNPIWAQVNTDSLGFQTFEYAEGDTTYVMKQYFIAFLKSGDNRSHSKEEAADIQEQHLAHINWMASEGYVDMAGPFGDEGEIRGILIMRVPTQEKAEEIAAMDPAVKAGRLKIEIHPWWAAKGSCLK